MHDLVGSRSLRQHLLAIGLLLAASVTAPEWAWAQTANGAFPNGASAVSESYGDWAMNCTLRDGRKSCSLVHQQVDNRSNQRVVAVEINVRAADRAEGNVIVPFGLLFEPGVTIQLDDGAPSAPFKVRTCVPGGCTVPVTFEAKVLDAIRRATTLKINGAAADTEKPVSFSVPLKGFAPAYARAVALSK